MFVKQRFQLDKYTKDMLQDMEPPFGYDGYGEFIFYRTYSRQKQDESQENWADVVIRNTEGTFSIRKDWYIKNHIHWYQSYWQEYARKFALNLFRMKWMPPGRGLWAMGTDYIYETGSMALYNCSFTKIHHHSFGEDIEWMMDCLMNGVGVGFEALGDIPGEPKFQIYKPIGTYDWIIPDSREGWAESEKRLINAFTHPNEPLPRFIYDKIRPAGVPIKRFGGVASGPEPLKKFHEDTIKQFELFGTRPQYDVVFLKGNIANMTGKCVVAGNVRRSAELWKGSPHHKYFMDFKNYDLFPERTEFGWMSNNSVALKDPQDFELLGEIAKRVIRNGEPGYINLRNFPYGRIGKLKDKEMFGIREDDADGSNPCGEIDLVDKETCNVDETLPTMCDSNEEWQEESCDFAITYATTVSLLPTHSHLTNKVVSKNRRIGVGIVDVSGWKHAIGTQQMTKWLRKGYEHIVHRAAHLNDEAGVPRPIRHTTIKPGGTGPKLPGKTPGAGWPTFEFTIRRTRVAKNSPLHPLLVEANIPFEQDIVDKYTDVFEYPIIQGPAPPVEEVTIWEQAMNLVLLQREWSDNAVSNTLYFRPKWSLSEITDNRDEISRYLGVIDSSSYFRNLDKSLEYIIKDKLKIKYNADEDKFYIYHFDERHEENHIEPVLSAIAPLTKTVSVCPHTPNGVYKQMPEEGISKEEYLRRKAQIKKIDWSKLKGSDGIDEKYCSGPNCERPITT